MICYLVRHGQDDDTVRGGWSDASLTSDGFAQAKCLADQIQREHVPIDRIYSSDLKRARQTAEVLAEQLDIPICFRPEFRETNNGDLAGMKHELANERYPGLYWNTLGWNERYPNGESPSEFCSRIQNAWEQFKAENKNEEYVLLVTHSGVINVILCTEQGIPYSNQKKPIPVPHATLIPLTI